MQIILEQLKMEYHMSPNIKPGNTNTEPTINFPPTEEVKEAQQKYSLSKFDYDLYKDEDNTAEPVVRVKRISLPNDGERWKIFSDSKTVMIIEGSKFSKKEREFLRSVDGISWLLSQAKAGIKSFNSLKTDLKKRIKLVKT